MTENVDIDHLISNREAFNKFVYTPLDEAVRELDERSKDKKLKEYVKKTLPIGVPNIIEDGKKYAFLARVVATPNHESHRFLSVIDVLDHFIPVFWEYIDDKFTPNMNEIKYHLARMTFYLGRGKKGGEKITNLRVVDFNVHGGKKISDVKTIWGQSLSDFHHEFFKKHYAHHHKLNNPIFFDGSAWQAECDNDIKIYYKYIFTLFLTHGIIFENFLLNNKGELVFIKEVFLPIFLSILKDTGKKPLIVALEPTDIEGDKFWMYYPHEYKKFVEYKMSSFWKKVWIKLKELIKVNN